ncbi:hypothetical protein [Saccharopolyspora sp. SCSIO 74807]|uniref:hypothetical protein n=1 Tax=Saccharopolyspora sp. SCSIO 74807 TaxID=3118084 RepID=UPI0030D1A20A
MFPRDILDPPRVLLERSTNLVHLNRMGTAVGTSPGRGAGALRRRTPGLLPAFPVIRPVRPGVRSCAPEDGDGYLGSIVLAADQDGA